MNLHMYLRKWLKLGFPWQSAVNPHFWDSGQMFILESRVCFRVPCDTRRGSAYSNWFTPHFQPTDHTTVMGRHQSCGRIDFRKRMGTPPTPFRFLQNVKELGQIMYQNNNAALTFLDSQCCLGNIREKNIHYLSRICLVEKENTTNFIIFLYLFFFP